MTGADGRYTFPAQRPGSYSVVGGPVTGAGFVNPNVGSDATDSDVDQSGAASVSFISGQAPVVIDAGLTRGTIGDRVWNDLNGNGAREGGEPGMPGVAVSLYRGGQFVDSRTTDSSGTYRFDDLDGGSYTVSDVPPGGYITTTPAGGSHSVSLSAGQSVLTADFDVYLPAPPPPPLPPGTGSIGDWVWNDWNGNGIQDDGASGLNGVTVNLWQGGTKIATTTTTGSGWYSFTGLADGNYKVQFIPPSGYIFSPADQGNDALDSDVEDTTNGYTATFALSGGSGRTDIDAGLLQLGSGSGFAFATGAAGGPQAPGFTPGSLSTPPVRVRPVRARPVQVLPAPGRPRLRYRPRTGSVTRTGPLQRSTTTTPRSSTATRR